MTVATAQAREAARAAELRGQADRVGRDYPVEVTSRLGYLCARLPDDHCAHWDAGDEEDLRRKLDAAGVPRREAAP